MNRPFRKIILYGILLLAVFAAQQQLTGPSAQYVTPKSGFADLSPLDLSRQLAHIVERNWEYYPGHSYTPEDFHDGAIAGPLPEGGTSWSDCGTYRLTVALPSPDRVYAVTGRSFPFAYRVFIDGRLIDETDIPDGTGIEDVLHKRSYSYHFAPKKNTAEIVFHIAALVQREGARNASLIIAESPLVERSRALELIRTNLVAGCFATVFFYFMGMFIFFSRRPHFLFFALACLATALRMTVMGEKYLMAVFPGLNWFAAFRIEYACLVLLVVFLQLYFAALYPGMLPRAFVAAVVGLSAAYGLIVLFGETPLFARLLKWYSLVWAAACAVTMWKMALRLRRGDLHTTLIFVGLMVFAAAALFDEATYRFLYHVRVHHTIVAGMLVCVFMNMIALTLDFFRIEADMAEVRARQRDLDETNRLLDRLNTMKTQFLANISHEMKTPLTVMSVHAQLSKALLAAAADHGEVAQSLDTISQESGRLARMVDGVLELGAMREFRGGMGILDVGLLVRRCAEVFRALAGKKGNILELDIPERPLRVYGDADMLTQVVINLLANANRHTNNGRIRVATTDDGKAVTVSVEDSGSGVDPQILPRVFERHAKDGEAGGTGLGLPICRSIIERHGGAIGMESVQGIRTTAHFSLPSQAGGEDGN